MTQPKVLPATEIMKQLRARGSVEQYRISSPALSAICQYPEFEAALEAAAGDGRGTGKDRNEEGNSGNAGAAVGLCKEEFCAFFDAITDLVELNHLSLSETC
ncbi:unnamed protein product [Choristocarpus tenellus]